MRTTQATLLLFRQKEKTGSCGPVITVTAEWSVHGFAEPKKSSEEETLTLGTLTTNNDESIFTTVTKCHKKAHTHTLPPALPLTPRAKPFTLTGCRPPRCPDDARATSHSAHSNGQRQIPTKGILPTQGDVTQHESPPRVTTHTSTGPTNGRSVWGWTPLWIQEFRFPRICTDFFFFSSSQLGVLAFQAAQQPQQGLCPLAVVGTDFLYCTQDSGTAQVLSRQRLVYSPAQRPPAASRGRLAMQRSNGAFFTILITNITIKLQWPLIYILILRT